uniref:integumentary mucin B.1-like n=1 Tax=Pristiophorus japonicus TaxID=55135 RepID=UPI00398E3E90
MRPNGIIEPSNCCHQTAFDWKVDVPNKPYCKSAPQNQPCTVEPTPTPCSPIASVCDIISQKPFEKCDNTLLKPYQDSCREDHCLVNSTQLDCINIKAAADSCRENTCVDWRSSVDGCNFTCNETFVFKPCELRNDDYCEDNKVIVGMKLTAFEEGCFCPSGMKLSEDKTTCVHACCLDSTGKRRENGESWIDLNNNCTSYICTKQQVSTQKKMCADQPHCKESDKKWDDDHCCYECNEAGICKMINRNVNVTKEVNNTTCSKVIMMNICEGTCPGSAKFNTQSNTMEHMCECCQEIEIEEKRVKLNCLNGGTEWYTYTSIKSCDCNAIVCPAPSP